MTDSTQLFFSQALMEPLASRVTISHMKSYFEQTEAQLGQMTGWSVLDNGFVGFGGGFGWYAELCVSFEHGDKEGGLVKLSLDYLDNINRWRVSELLFLHPGSNCEANRRHVDG